MMYARPAGSTARCTVSGPGVSAPDNVSPTSSSSGAVAGRDDASIAEVHTIEDSESSRMYPTRAGGNSGSIGT